MRIDNQTESRLMDVLTKVAELTTEGVHPNDAIIKLGANVLRPGEVELVVRGYNIGKTNEQRETGEDLLQKTAVFQLADADIVNNALFTKKVAAVSRSVSAEYSQSPRAVLQRISDFCAAPVAVKAAAAVTAVQPPAPAALTIKQARESHTATHRKLVAAIDEIGDYFRDRFNPSQPAVKAAAETLFGETETAAIFDVVYASQPALQQIRSFSGPVTKVAASNRIFQLFDAVIKTAREYGEAGELLGGLTPPEAPAAPRYFSGASLLDGFTVATKEGEEKEALFMPTLGAMQSGSSDTIRNLQDFGDRRTNPEAAIGSALHDLTDPDHEESLRQLESQSTLQELLSRDSTLRGYKPQQVADSFSQVSQMAPLLSSKTLAMQPFLRKYLEQGGRMDTFDVNDMISMNNGLQPRFSAMNDGAAQPTNRI